jgi:hypothetical protein
MLRNPIANLLYQALMAHLPAAYGAFWGPICNHKIYFSLSFSGWTVGG